MCPVPAPAPLFLLLAMLPGAAFAQGLSISVPAAGISIGVGGGDGISVSTPVIEVSVAPATGEAPSSPPAGGPAGPASPGDQPAPESGTTTAAVEPMRSIDGAAPAGSSGSLAIQSDQDSALTAVRQRRALPLEQIAEAVGTEHDGRIIDARLMTVHGFLLYELKVLKPTGTVSQLYYYASSGLPVR